MTVLKLRSLTRIIKSKLLKCFCDYSCFILISMSVLSIVQQTRYFHIWTRKHRKEIRKRISSWHSTLVFVPITFKREENLRSCENLRCAEFSQTVFSVRSSVFERRTSSKQTIRKWFVFLLKFSRLHENYVVRGVVDTENSLCNKRWDSDMQMKTARLLVRRK